MKKVELLPTRDCEAGYGSDPSTGNSTDWTVEKCKLFHTRLNFLSSALFVLHAPSSNFFVNCEFVIVLLPLSIELLPRSEVSLHSFAVHL